ncbi:hypothetical protein MNBD_GAMMA08-127 [hydrothermal vent metagenome]|uniref:HipA-like C-terminal domain-containing protein n=1 Tax=hydrothermal vent metagenome TaxID=652676 RepID=A0A3B0XDS1_9ZZZZ
MAMSVSECLERAPATSKEIQALTGLGQTAVARHIRSMGDRVIALKAGRSIRYAMTRNAFGCDDNLPLSMVDANGSTVLVAVIRPLAHGGFFVEEVTGMPRLLLGESGNGLYDDLPYFLSDLAPQGFIGRKITAELASCSDSFPSDPRRWNSNHIGRYLISNGEDLHGNFKFGIQASSRIRRKPVHVTREDYPGLADSIMSGEVVESSAGGEQPKFTAYCSERSAHVIVKFSPKGEGEIARRWRDVLITEYHATKALLSHSLPAAETVLFEKEGRLFLESKRFDRSGEYGRVSMVSLSSVDAEFVGSGENWLQAMDGLLHQNLIAEFHYYDAKILWAFGKLINNTDMHLGNLSLGMEGSVFRLRPIYDMCSMGFAPKGSGEIPPLEFTAPSFAAAELDESKTNKVIRAARDFWSGVASDDRISDEFKMFLTQ